MARKENVIIQKNSIIRSYVSRNKMTVRDL